MKYMMKDSHFAKPVLVFDTAFGGCVVAVFDPRSGVSASRILPTEREQSIHLMPLIKEAMDEAKVEFQDLGLLVTNPGPGSFTGLRISLISAKSLALTLNIPVQGVDSFVVMAKSCLPPKTANQNILVILESKRADFYGQWLSPDFKPIEPAFCGYPDAFLDQKFKGSILCGDATARLHKEIGSDQFDLFYSQHHANALLNPHILLEEGVRSFVANAGVPPKLEPVYLRDPDVSTPKTKYRHIENF